MKTLVARRLPRALLLAFMGIASIAQASATHEPSGGVTEATEQRPTDRRSLEAEERSYAAREAAAPELGQFKGGGVGIYIGGSALTVVLVVILIVILI